MTILLSGHDMSSIRELERFRRRPLVFAYHPKWRVFRMQLRWVLGFFLLACLAMAVTAFAKRSGDPLSGTWTGDWGPNANDRNNVNVDLKLDGKALTGTVHSVNPPR